jgi:hypothetical protein
LTESTIPSPSSQLHIDHLPRRSIDDTSGLSPEELGMKNKLNEKKNWNFVSFF